MTTDEFKALYTRDEEGHRHYHGPERVRYAGKLYYPARLLFELMNKRPVKPMHSLIRQCDVEDCISPDHRIETLKDEPIRAYRFSASSTKAI